MSFIKFKNDLYTAEATTNYRIIQILFTKSLNKESDKTKPMAKKGVVGYIRNMLQRGYNLQLIRSELLKNNYTDQEINAAIQEVYNPTVRHEIHFGTATLIVIAIVSLAGLGAAYFLFFANSGNEKLLDVNLEPVKTTVSPGQEIVFVKELANQGSSKRYDVKITQQIVDRSGNMLTEKSETRAIENFGSTQTRILIPSDAKQGDYTLKVIVSYDKKEASATLPVKVISQSTTKKETCFDGIKNQNEENIDCGGICKACAADVTIADCNDYNKCTNDKVQNGKCAYEDIKPCCGNSVCEENEDCPGDCNKGLTEYTSQNLAEIKEIAKNEPEKAMQECGKIEVPKLRDTCVSNVGEAQKDESYCTKIKDPQIRDLCYQSIAQEKNDAKLCEKITTDSRKDTCYTNYFLANKDYSVCGKITNKGMRDSCESLKMLNEMQQNSEVAAQP